MAERRMFSKKVTDDDNFMSLSSSAQALYLHLMMSADDDGFCNQISLSMFKAHASVQDLEALMNKRYIYQFENGVIVIKHWRMANALRKDRYSETLFQKELSQLQLDDTGVYCLKPEKSEQSVASRLPDGCQSVARWLPDGCQSVARWLPDGCQSVAKRLPQDSIGKDSIGKVNNKYTCAFEDFWKAYPRRKEKGNAYRCYQARLNDGWSDAEMLEAAKAYAEDCRKNKTTENYIKLPATFLSCTTPFTDFLRKEGGDGTEKDSGSDGTTGKILTDEEKRELIARLEADDTELNFEDLL